MKKWFDNYAKDFLKIDEKSFATLPLYFMELDSIRGFVSVITNFSGFPNLLNDKEWVQKIAKTLWTHLRQLFGVEGENLKFIL